MWRSGKVVFALCSLSSEWGRFCQELLKKWRTNLLFQCVRDYYRQFSDKRCAKWSSCVRCVKGRNGCIRSGRQTCVHWQRKDFLKWDYCLQALLSLCFQDTLQCSKWHFRCKKDSDQYFSEQILRSKETMTISSKCITRSIWRFEVILMQPMFQIWGTRSL